MKLTYIIKNKEVYEPGILTLIISAFIINGLIGFEFSLSASKAGTTLVILSLNEYPITYISLLVTLSIIFTISFTLTIKGIIKNITSSSTPTGNR